MYICIMVPLLLRVIPNEITIVEREKTIIYLVCPNIYFSLNRVKTYGVIEPYMSTCIRSWSQLQKEFLF